MDYSQYEEQSFLLNYFKDNTKGTLVDIGAADGINNSNSKKLIELGWSGLLVEPTPLNYQKLINLYSGNTLVNIENCGCGNKTENLTFYIDNNDEYHQISTFSVEQKIGCEQYFKCTFHEINSIIYNTQELFTKHNLKKIDFISIDTEGYDDNVLFGINFNETLIDLICIENTTQVSENLLYSRGYELVHKTSGNTFYKNNKFK